METVRNGLEGADRQLVTYVGVCTSAVALLSSCHAVSSACSRTDIQCLRIVRVISPIRVVSILTVGARARSCSHACTRNTMRWNGPRAHKSNVRPQSEQHPDECSISFHFSCMRTRNVVRESMSYASHIHCFEIANL